MSVNTSAAQAGIVVGVDGSDESLLALRWALAEGARRSEVVEVVHCWYPRSMVDAVFGNGAEMRTGSECMLQNEVAKARNEFDGAPEVRTLSVHGRPVSTLVARSSDARLLVVGDRGYTGLKERLLGYVSDGCVRRARCSVVVVGDGKVTVTPAPVAAVGADAVMPVW
ncbi:universal stress protein [Nakamurella sp. A5-74]|uniref:Universal stress protein n=1 Tax=Nakamurella sp. A5-74 TaxID=3158264 RepID=A0AAU8DV23_9ACTN